MTKVDSTNVFSIPDLLLSPHLRPSRFHQPSQSCECWISFHVENSFGTWTQSSLTNTKEMTKVAFKRRCAASGSLSSSHLRSSQFHGPSRNREWWISFHIEDSFGMWTQSSLTDTNKMTKVAFNKGVPHPDLSFRLIESVANSMSLAGTASAEYHSSSRFPLGCEHIVH